MEITAADIRLWSQVNWTGTPYVAANPDPLTMLVTQARAYVQQVTGRVIAELDEDSDLGVLMAQAVRMRVEQLVYQQSASAVAKASDDTFISSFSVPGYSESRSMRAEPDQGNRPRINVWPLLDDLLWLLMTDEKREWWLIHLKADANAPAFALTELDWGGPLDDVPGSAPSSYPGWGDL